jgi:hypothetical protein
MGERVLADVTEPANEDDSFGTRTIIARSISNVASHPGKTLDGCSYRIELLDREGIGRVALPDDRNWERQD